jgi:hypothetical protein
LIDFSDNQCWEDICEVLTPSGYPVFRDDDHYPNLYAQHWAGSVDFLVDFEENEDKDYT